MLVHSALVGPALTGFYLQCPYLDSSNSANSAKGVCSLLMGKCSPRVPAVICHWQLGSRLQAAVFRFLPRPVTPTSRVVPSTGSFGFVVKGYHAFVASS
jgi:hypothetical protein